MKCRTIAKRIRTTGLVLGLIALGLSSPLSQAWAVECGAVLNGGNFILNQDVVCGPGNENNPAITLTGSANLNLNGYTIDCNETARDGILITGTRATILNGTVEGCTRDGVNISGDQNQIVRITSQNNTRRGFHVGGDDNHFVNCLATANGQQGFNVADGFENHFVNCVAEGNGRHGFKIDGGNDNHIRNSEALNNCRDGIEIEGGNENSVINNLAENNGNERVCERFGQDYLPWFYAGIDILAGAGDNKVINNEASGNMGCVLTPGQTSCEARERNLWDENVANDGACNATNRWVNNRAGRERIAPECIPGP